MPLDLLEGLDTPLEDEPPLPPPTDRLTLSRRDRARRLAGIGAGLAACGLTAAIGVANVGLLSAPSPATRPAPDDIAHAWDPYPLPATPEQYRTECTRPTQSDPRQDQRLFAGGARLTAATTDQMQATALFASADGRYWGRCTVWPGWPRSVTLMVFRGTEPSARSDNPPTVGVTTCQATCRDSTSIATRLAPEVSRVEATYLDGETLVGVTRDGWVALSHDVGPVVVGDPDRPQVLQRLRYYDVGGDLLAEWTADPAARDDSVPGLSAYRSLPQDHPLGHIPSLRTGLIGAEGPDH